MKFTFSEQPVDTPINATIVVTLFKENIGNPHPLAQMCDGRARTLGQLAPESFPKLSNVIFVIEMSVKRSGVST